MISDFIKKIVSGLSEKQHANKNTNFNEDTTKTILEVAKSEYINENERNKHIEDKAKSLITLSGVLITMSLSIIKAINDNGWFAFLVFVLLIIVVFLVIAIWMLLQMFKMREFHKIPLSAIITNIEMHKDNCEVMANLSVSYEEATIKNRALIDDKITSFNKSVGFVEVSILLLIIISAIIALQNTDYVQNKIQSNKSHSTVNSNNLSGCYVCHIEIHAAKLITEHYSVKPKRRM